MIRLLVCARSDCSDNPGSGERGGRPYLPARGRRGATCSRYAWPARRGLSRYERFDRRAAHPAVGDHDADALVIDIGLPDADGRDVVQALRVRGVGTPVIFLTARDALPDRLAGFAAGGDDYLTKPFAFAELVARLRALIKRGGADIALEIGGLRLDPAIHGASCGDQAVGLSPTEFRILACLASAPGDGDSAPRPRTGGLASMVRSCGTTRSTSTSRGYVGSSRVDVRRTGVATVHGVGYSLR